MGGLRVAADFAGDQGRVGLEAEDVGDAVMPGRPTGKSVGPRSAAATLSRLCIRFINRSRSSSSLVYVVVSPKPPSELGRYRLPLPKITLSEAYCRSCRAVLDLRDASSASNAVLVVLRGNGPEDVGGEERFDETEEDSEGDEDDAAFAWPGPRSTRSVVDLLPSNMAINPAVFLGNRRTELRVDPPGPTTSSSVDGRTGCKKLSTEAGRGVAPSPNT